MRIGFKLNNRFAFTMAEVLIVLGIIGFVAALVLPPLIANTQDAEYKAGKDKVRMSIAEAGRILVLQIVSRVLPVLRILWRTT